MADQDEEKTGLDIDWLRTFAGALAAVTSAVLLSTLGAAGTIIGAALGSVAATVATSVYAHGLARSRATVAKAHQLTHGKVGVAQAEVRRAARRQGDEEAVEAHLEVADERLAEARAELDRVADEAAPETLGSRLAALPWKRVALTAAAMFAVVFVAITAFEVVTGQSVSSRTGGSDDGRTTIGSVTRDGGSREDRAPSPEPSGSPTTEDPGVDPEETATPTEPVEPTGSTTPTPTEQPTEAPTEAPAESVPPATPPAPVPTAPATP